MNVFYKCIPEGVCRHHEGLYIVEESHATLGPNTTSTPYKYEQNLPSEDKWKFMISTVVCDGPKMTAELVAFKNH